MMQTNRINRGWLVMLALCLLFSVGIATAAYSDAALAQGDAPAAADEVATDEVTTDEVTADEVTADEVTADEVNVVARGLWCPLCSGVRLDACELKACEQMKDVIAIKLAEGEDAASIKAYFVEQYGPQVMGEPPLRGFNWLAWILPAVVVAAGGLIFWRTAKRMVQPATLAANETPASRAATAKQAAAAVNDKDEYNQKLEEELAKYG